MVEWEWAQLLKTKFLEMKGKNDFQNTFELDQALGLL